MWKMSGGCKVYEIRVLNSFWNMAQNGLLVLTNNHRWLRESQNIAVYQIMETEKIKELRCALNFEGIFQRVCCYEKEKITQQQIWQPY